MATTTNYSWTTPDDTDLVKDGASAIRTLGSSIDTSVKALSPGTTAGDIDYYTTSTAKARLGIGTAGQVLSVNSGATAPEWTLPASGGITLLSTTTLSGATTTISAISGAYKNLYGIIHGVIVSGFTDFRMAPNNNTGISDSVYQYTNNSGQELNTYAFITNGGLHDSGGNNGFYFGIKEYASTTALKPHHFHGSYKIAGDTSWRAIQYAGLIKTTSAITSLVFSSTGGSFSAGTVLLYGEK